MNPTEVEKGQGSLDSSQRSSVVLGFQLPCIQVLAVVRGESWDIRRPHDNLLTSPALGSTVIAAINWDHPP